MDRSANARFEALYRTHQTAVSRCVARLGLPREAWPDIVQEVWITAARRLASLEAHPRAVAWLCSVARNHAMHHCRNAARRQRKYQAIAIEGSREHDDPFGERDAWDTLNRLLADCPLEQRDVYLKIELHGLSAADVAEELGISINTVNSRLRLTRNRLRESGPALIAALILFRARTAEAAYGGSDGLIGATTETAISTQAGKRSARAVGITGKLALVALLVLSPSASQTGEQHDLVPRASPSLTQAPEPLDSVHPRLHVPWANEPPTLGRQALSAVRPPLEQPRRAAASTGQRSLARPSPSLHNDGRDLYRDALDALHAGRGDKALKLALLHRKQYPISQLRDSRELIIIRALCQAGDSREARKQAEEFARESPNQLAMRARAFQQLQKCR